jgi:monoamine oxidase
VDVFEADYCFSNIAVPFLKEIVSDKLQKIGQAGGFSKDFKASLDAVYDGQFGPTVEIEDDDGKPKIVPRTAEYKFQACSTKVGWQADRYLWQGSDIESVHDDDCNADTNSVPDSEVGIVPIFGGISWTENDITQVWYPSTAYHDKKGILTGAYNFGKIAAKWGTMSVQSRLDQARTEAKDFSVKFGEGLHDGLAIAWQNMPYIKGGWAQWEYVNDPVTHFNNMAQGTEITDKNGTTSDPRFFVIGDQLSSLPGWQEGAIASALNALSRMERPDLAIPYLAELPNTKLMVEGV